MTADRASPVSARCGWKDRCLYLSLFFFRSRATEAQRNGLFDAEIVPVKVKLVGQDGGVSLTTVF